VGNTGAAADAPPPVGNVVTPRDSFEGGPSSRDTRAIAVVTSRDFDARARCLARL
jgi:hypothetical protein